MQQDLEAEDKYDAKSQGSSDGQLRQRDLDDLGNGTGEGGIIDVRYTIGSETGRLWIWSIFPTF